MLRDKVWQVASVSAPKRLDPCPAAAAFKMWPFQLSTCFVWFETGSETFLSLLPRQKPVSYSWHAMCAEAVCDCAQAGACLRQVGDQACQVPLPLQLSRQQLHLPRAHTLCSAFC